MDAQACRATPPGQVTHAALNSFLAQHNDSHSDDHLGSYPAPAPAPALPLPSERQQLQQSLGSTTSPQQSFCQQQEAAPAVAAVVVKQEDGVQEDHQAEETDNADAIAANVAKAVDNGNETEAEEPDTEAAAEAPVAPICMVDGCGVDLSDLKPYFRRSKVCPAHQAATSVLLAGVKNRFCQQCTRCHPVGQFDGTKRSCRNQLTHHNKSRKHRRRCIPGSFYRSKRPRTPHNGAGVAEAKKKRPSQQGSANAANSAARSRSAAAYKHAAAAAHADDTFDTMEAAAAWLASSEGYEHQYSIMPVPAASVVNTISNGIETAAAAAATICTADTAAGKALGDVWSAVATAANALSSPAAANSLYRFGSINSCCGHTLAITNNTAAAAAGAAAPCNYAGLVMPAMPAMASRQQQYAAAAVQAAADGATSLTCSGQVLHQQQPQQQALLIQQHTGMPIAANYSGPLVHTLGARQLNKVYSASFSCGVSHMTHFGRQQHAGRSQGTSELQPALRHSSSWCSSKGSPPNTAQATGTAMASTQQQQQQQSVMDSWIQQHQQQAMSCYQQQQVHWHQEQHQQAQQQQQQQQQQPYLKQQPQRQLQPLYTAGSNESCNTSWAQGAGLQTTQPIMQYRAAGTLAAPGAGLANADAANSRAAKQPGAPLAQFTTSYQSPQQQQQRQQQAKRACPDVSAGSNSAASAALMAAAGFSLTGLPRFNPDVKPMFAGIAAADGHCSPGVSFGLSATLSLTTPPPGVPGVQLGVEEDLQQESMGQIVTSLQPVSQVGMCQNPLPQRSLQGVEKPAGVLNFLNPVKPLIWDVAISAVNAGDFLESENADEAWLMDLCQPFEKCDALMEALGDLF